MTSTSAFPRAYLEMNYTRKSLSQWTFIAMLSVCASLLSCSEPSVKMDSWEQRAPDDFPRVEEEEIDPALFAPVAEGRLRRAVPLLETAKWREISEAEAAMLTSNPPRRPGKLYLVRGVCIGCGTGDFSLYLKGRSLLVSHLGFAGLETPSVRWPVIVVLQHPPEELFVECAAPV